MSQIDLTPPEIDYLAKDYASFRRLMLDHLTSRIPEWNEPSAADLGNVIVEVLAYAADYLSYYQDAVATEAYLGTARRRRSVKRHVRLLDYLMHEGCNARVWVHVQASARLTLPKRTQLLTRADRLEAMPLIPAGSPNYYAALAQGVGVFETTHAIRLFPEHNEIALYSPERRPATLDRGSTRATLRGRMPYLRPGHVLVFEQVKNDETGDEIGADPDRRHAVLLTEVAHEIVRDGEHAVHVARVAWADDDALPFDLPITIYRDGDYFGGLSVARGNMVLADHGRTIMHERLPDVPPNVRYRPGLQNTGLTYGVPDDLNPTHLRSASAALSQDVRQALPAIALFELSRSVVLADEGASALDAGLSDPLRQALQMNGLPLAGQVELTDVPGVGLQIRDRVRGQHLVAAREDNQLVVKIYKKWSVRPDLLASGPQSTDYIVDMEDDGRVYLRFGFGGHGRLPQPGDRFVASYRIGNGSGGNVRADTIAHVVTTDSRILRVRNPLAAQGGTDREPIDDARLYAPHAFQSQQRCVTPEDYVTIAMRHPQVLNAVAEIVWTGSWPTAFVYVQRRGGAPVDARFQAALSRFMEPFRVAGYEIAIRAPEFVPLDVALNVALKRGYDPNSTGDALAHMLGSQAPAPGAAGGFFYPDNFTFGQAVYLSQIVAAAMTVPGVARVEVARLARLDGLDADQPAAHIAIGRHEIARLADDPRAPERGRLKLNLMGGL